MRGLLLPAALALLGKRAWELPGWLSWLPGKGEPRRLPDEATDRAGAENVARTVEEARPGSEAPDCPPGRAHR